jgi:acyl-CoA thioester hydrolase
MIRPPPAELPVHAHPVRVYFEDTDAGGMAYHATYLRWAERGRTEALRAMRMPHRDMIARHNSILVVRRVEVEYAAPARLDDALVVETRVLAVKGVTMRLDQRMLRGEDGATLAVLGVELACVDKDTLRPRRIPEPWRSALAAGDAAARAASGAGPGMGGGGAAPEGTGAVDIG